METDDGVVEIGHSSRGGEYVVLKEEAPPTLHWWKASLDQVEEAFGAGNRLYFSFQKFLLVCNAVLAILALGPWISYMRDPNRVAVRGGFEWKDFFASEYLRSTSRVWLGICITLWILAAFVIPLAYFLWERFVFRQRASRKYGGGSDAILENIALSRTTRFKWRFLVAVLFVGAVALGSAFFYGLTRLENLWQSAMLANTQNGVGNTSQRTLVAFVTSLLSSVFLVLINMAWVPICVALTRLEKHTSWGHFRISQASKLLAFKVFMLWALCIFMATSLQIVVIPGSFCLYLDAGTRFSAILVSDVLVTNGLALLAAFLVPWIRKKTTAFDCLFLSKRDPKDPQNEEPLKHEFNISDETLQLGYRQFVLYLGLIVSPFLGFVAILGGLLEYLVSRLMMLKLTQHPRRVEERFGALLLGALIGIGLAAFFLYPNGYLWMLFAPHLVPNGYTAGGYDVSVTFRNGTTATYFIPLGAGCLMWNAANL